MKYLVLSTLVLAGACSFKKNPLVNQTQNGHEELYSEPDAPKPFESEEVQRVVIAATNDVEGHFDPHRLTFTDLHSPGLQQTLVGGADAAAAYLKILREQFKDILLVDAGDVLSPKRSLKEITSFYESNGYDALTLGLSDFNVRLPKGVSSTNELFSRFAKESKVPLVLSNLYELKTARVVEWKGAVPYLMKSVGGVSVGIIGLIPDDVANLSPVDSRVGLFVENMLTNTLRHSRLLRSLGAEIIVVLTHQGLRCGQALAQEARLPLEKVNFEPKKAGVCDTSGALGAYLERLPPHLVDVVISGREHEKTANYVNETLVLSGFGEGKSMIYAEFFVDKKSKKVLKDRTVVHQPVMFCREFFKETRDCFTKDPSVDHRERIGATFLGQELKLTTPAVTFSPGKRSYDHDRALSTSAADLAFVPTKTGGSRFLKLKVRGRHLLKILEEDFNSGAKEKWYPSPFIVNGDDLKLLINGKDLELEEEYTILTDVEGARSHSKLLRTIADPGNETIGSSSWNSFEQEDSVDTKLAARAR